MLVRIRAAAATRLRPFSTTAAVSNAAAELKDAMAQLAGELEKEGDKQTNNLASETIRPVHKYQTISPSTFIRPYDLSLQGRSFKERPPFRRPNIPPATRDARKNDVFHQLAIDPLKLALHPAVLAPFMSEMAMIYPRYTTGLTSKSQRRIAKAIRRAKMMGVIPLHSKPRL